MQPDEQRTYELLISATDKGLDQLTPRGLQAEEALSQPFRVTVEACTQDPADPGSMDPSAWLRKKLAVGLVRGGEPTWFHGVVVAVEHTGADHQQRQLYRIELAPAMALLQHTRQTRVFADLKPLEAVQKVLSAGSVALEMKATGAGGVQRHITQYEESDLAFASRMMEQEGACYWFAHTKSAHRLVVGDTAGHHPGKDAAVHASFSSAASYDTASEGVVTALSRRFDIVPEEAVVRDYSESHPKQPAEGRKPVPGDKAPGAGGKHAEADYHVTMSDGDATGYAGRIAEALISRSCRVVGASGVLAFRAGSRVAVHGKDGYDEHLLLVQVTHTFDGTAYRNQFSAVPVSRLPWRPPRATPIPRIDGVIPAIVTSAAGAQGQGEDGAYKVRILGTGDQGERIVRMAQPSSGSTQGLHFPLQPNTEVVLAHVHGHPDRPVIAGAMVNAEDASPVKDANKTQSVLRTLCGSELVFEDASGKESITLRTPKGNLLCFDDENELASMEAPKDHKITVLGKSDTAVTGKTTLDCQDEITISAANKITLKVGGSTITIEPAKITIDTTDVVINASAGIKAAGATIEAAAQSSLKASATDIDIAAKAAANLSATQVEIAGKASAKMAAAQVEVAGQATAKFSAGAQCEISGAMTKVSGSGICEIKGGVVKNN
jgi:type VI secretion system secreted protein VgrG